VKGVIGHQAAPHQVPQGIKGFARVSSADCFVQLRKEGGAGANQLLHEGELTRAQRVFRRRLGTRGQQEPEFIGQEQGDAPIVLAQRVEPDPGYLARGNQSVQATRRIVRQTRRED
jgi:hypothetical protein